ncbi:hypothetical protein C6501_01880 [Candidatus Poribacteria bacterium]|nr:MAG: hypothetical protein C6501_01880 [Candidatus Poribacteria bacterium]
MKNTYPLFSLTSLVLVLLLFTSTAYCDIILPDPSGSEQYVIVDRENGDRLTGTFRGATDTHFEIEYNGQVLRFPLKGHTLNFFSDLENVPNQIAAKHYRNGLALLDLESPELAKRKFEAALEEFPKFADAHYQLGLLYKIDGDIDNTLARFRTVALIDAQNFDLVPLLQEIGNNAIAIGNYIHAVNAFQLILKHYPEHESVAKLSYQTGFLLVKELKDVTAGLELLQKAVNQFPNLPEHEEAVYQIAVLQAETGELENALNILKQFSRIYPNSDWVDDAHLKRAIIYLQIGDRKNAVNVANLVRQNSDDTTIIEQANDVLQASAWNIYTDNLPDPNIQAIAVDGTSLWIGTPKGIAQIETGGNGGWKANEAAAWRINDNEHVSTAPDVRAIAVNKSEVWVGTRNQGILHFNKKTTEVKNYTIADGLPSMWIRDIKMDNEEIWFATDAGVVQQNLKTGIIEAHYNQENDNIPNDIHSIALTPEGVWVGTSGNDIAVFDRESELWESKNFLEIKPETEIVRFDVVKDKTLFSWYNEEKRGNGFFKANWNGADGVSYPVESDLEVQEDLNDIFVTGVADKKYLWVAVKHYVTIYDLHTDTYVGTIDYPKIVLEDLSVQCIAIDNDRAWIGTNKGMLMIEKQKFSQAAE